jgi:tetratricopeptide (TPR) repeat protein
MKPIWRAFACLVALACTAPVAIEAQTQLPTKDILNLSAGTRAHPNDGKNRRVQGSDPIGKSSPANGDDCAASGRDGIAACDRVIASRKFTGRRLAFAHYNRGLAWLEMGEYDRAIADFDVSVRLDPTSAWTFNNRGSAWYAKADFDRAIADFDQAIRLDPEYALAYNNRGEVWKHRADFPRAIADYRQAIALDPSYAAAYTNRGLAYERMGDIARAREDFNFALSLPVKRGDGQEAHDTARERLATISAFEQSRAGPQDLALPVRPVPATPGQRIALVIGNSAYSAAPMLHNPRMDSELVATIFRSAAFDSVNLLRDLDRERFVKALIAFAHEAQHADWAVIYFAGHGMEIDGINYLIPVDARLEEGRAAPFEAVSLEQLLAAIDGARKLRLVMLDACRDNPFVDRMRSLAPTRSIRRGLAQTDPGPGTLVVYAAKHGEVALDGDARNSPFATALAKRLVSPGIEINQLFRLVRDDVMEMTGGRQEPYTYGSLPGAEQYYFVSRWDKDSSSFEIEVQSTKINHGRPSWRPGIVRSSRTCCRWCSHVVWRCWPPPSWRRLETSPLRRRYSMH